VDDGTPIDGIGMQADLYIRQDGKVHHNCGTACTLILDLAKGVLRRGAKRREVSGDRVQGRVRIG
jgi:hypothetical protein